VQRVAGSAASMIEARATVFGGRNLSAHADLQDGDTVQTGITMRRDLARDLAPLLYGPTIRLHGSGRFER
jgi:hypothetical protein